MAFSSTTLQPVETPVKEKPAENGAGAASLLSMLLLSVYAANKSKKEFRKLKRKFLWTAFKLKLASLFSKKRTSDRQLLIYILIGVVLLILIFTFPLAALILAILALVLILAGII